MWNAFNEILQIKKELQNLLEKALKYLFTENI